tara:strand:+ start:46 stop:264 length:219 start_codon:yes stop_codon:yes gene_type:complete
MINPPEVTLPLGTVLTCRDGAEHVFLGYTTNTQSTELNFFNTKYLGSPRPLIYRAVTRGTILRKFPTLSDGG